MKKQSVFQAIAFFTILVLLKSLLLFVVSQRKKPLSLQHGYMEAIFEKSGENSLEGVDCKKCHSWHARRKGIKKAVFRNNNQEDK